MTDEPSRSQRLPESQHRRPRCFNASDAEWAAIRAAAKAKGITAAALLRSVANPA